MLRPSTAPPPHFCGAGRSILEQGAGPFQLIWDTHEHNVQGLEKTLRFAKQQRAQEPTKTLIFSDLDDRVCSGGNVYDQVSGLLRRYHVHNVIGVGSEMTHHVDRFTGLCGRFYPNAHDLLKALDKKTERLTSQLVIVKSNPASELENVVQRLAYRQHRTVLEVNLDYLSHNLAVFKSRLSPTTKVMVVLKAFAYGSGGIQVARFLERCGIDCIGVVYTDEAVQLRRAGIGSPILVMNPVLTDLAVLHRYDLMAEVYSMQLLEGLQQAAAAAKVSLKVHIKLDTGMHRLGLQTEQVDVLVEKLRRSPNLHLVGIMSHLAAPEASQHDHYTREQHRTFAACAARIEAGLHTYSLKHLLSSIGVLRHGQFQMDMVRIGIGLYGVGPVSELAPELMPTHTLKTTVAQVKRVPSGATVGYGRAVKLSQDTQVAVLTIGYADGFSRALSHGQGGVWLHGQFAPVLGSVCMDMCMVDATHISVSEGDEAIVFSKKHRLEVASDAARTLPNEMLSCIGERVRRIYTGCGK